jgi:hypothetical protein
MQNLNMDGNVLGDVGSQALVAAIQRSTFTGNKSNGEPRRLKVSMNNCDCRQSAVSVFNAANPTGHWVLDLTEPYGLMVAKECIFLANYRAGCSIKHLVYNGKVIKLERRMPKGKKFDLEEYHTQCKSVSKDLLAGKMESASLWFEKILSQFSMSMIPKKRLEVLNVTKKNWMNKSKESPRTVRRRMMNLK